MSMEPEKLNDNELDMAGGGEDITSSDEEKIVINDQPFIVNQPRFRHHPGNLQAPREPGVSIP